MAAKAGEIMANVSSNQSWFDSEMANELRQLFYDQFGRQQNALNFLNSQAKAMVTNPTGFSPAALAALRAQSTDTVAGNFQNAQKALQEHEAQTGGSLLPSGVNANLDAGLYAKEAQAQAQGENEITLQNEDLKNQNYWRALGVLSGDAAAQNPQSYLSGSLDASAGVGSLADAATKANQSGFGSQLESGIASGLGRELTGGNSTGAASVGGFFGV